MHSSSHECMDHFPKIRRPFLDTSPSSSLAHESESESSNTSGSETPSPPVRSSTTFPSFTPPLEPNKSLRKSQDVESDNSKGWYEFDLSVIVALVSPIGNWLTGGDYVKNVLLILLLIFYLHQLIEVPWSLYHLSRPRHRPTNVPLRQTSAEQEVLRQLASSELRTQEMFYLSLTILSPLLGAALLRAVLISMAGPEAMSWFSTSLFIFATGLRPWKHAVERLRCRAQDLHTIIHYPPSSFDTQSQVGALTIRVSTLEAQLNDCKDAMKALTEEVFDHMEGTVDGLERSIRKQEKKNDINHAAHESRLVALEQNVEELLEKKEISVKGPTVTHEFTSALRAAVTEPLTLLFPEWARSSRTEKLPPSPRPSPKMGRPRAATKLETIPEGAVFASKKARGCFPSFRIPGLKFVLRIGDLATLPVRRVVAFLLTGRIYAPRVPASSS